MRIRGKNSAYETRTGSVSRTLNEVQALEAQRREVARTTERLRVLEKLEKYREERLQREIELFEADRRKEEEEARLTREAELKRVRYLERQRERLDQMRLKKAEDD